MLDEQNVLQTDDSSVSDYNDASIRTLKGAERIRKRPEVMLGSKGHDGALHTVQEIIGNAVDEIQAGYGNRIILHFLVDGGISIEDFGRGVPMDFNPVENRYNWDIIFNDMYGGGKYDESAYKTALGLNGLGACATQYTSEYMDVVSVRDGFIFEMHFKKGNPVSDLIKTENIENRPNGTKITWKPDVEVFREVNITYEEVKNYLIGQAHITKFIAECYNDITGDHEEIEGQGIEYLLTQSMGENIAIVSKTFKEIHGELLSGEKYNADGEFVLAINGYEKSWARYFHNTTEMQGTIGVHSKAYNDALSTFFKSVAKEKGWGKVTESDYKEYFSFIVSTHSNISSFANQTKNYINDGFIYDLIYKTLYEILTDLYTRNNEYLEGVLKSIQINIDARIKAKELQDAIKQVGKLSKTGKKKDPEKFCGCREKDPKKRELYIVEGDSALNACKLSRNADFQALMPIRGKTLNCLKVDTLKALASKIIEDLTTLVGTGVEIVDDNYSMFDMNKLQFDKIIFCTDADVDGFQIRVLLYTIFYRLMPKLLEAGKVYIVESPLFELETRGKSYFAYSVQERDSIMNKLANRGTPVLKVHRSKGLGENDPEMMAYTTMSPDTRKLTQLQIDPSNETVQALTEMLFGSDPAKIRKSFIINALGSGVGDMLDASFDIMTVHEESEEFDNVEGDGEDA